MRAIFTIILLLLAAGAEARMVAGGYLMQITLTNAGVPVAGDTVTVVSDNHTQVAITNAKGQAQYIQYDTDVNSLMTLSNADCDQIIVESPSIVQLVSSPGLIVPGYSIYWVESP